jgi:hypothetical protein
MSEGALDGKVALVTGASSGIGEARAVALAEAGASVAMGARRRDRLDALAATLREGGARVLQLDLDVTDEQACREAVARTRDELGGLDVLINNAGVMLPGTIVGADTEDWRRMVSTRGGGHRTVEPHHPAGGPRGVPADGAEHAHAAVRRHRARDPLRGEPAAARGDQRVLVRPTDQER